MAERTFSVHVSHQHAYHRDILRVDAYAGANFAGTALPSARRAAHSRTKSCNLDRCERTVVATSPFRHMVTPSGQTMSVAMTNCGNAGWDTRIVRV